MRCEDTKRRFATEALPARIRTSTPARPAGRFNMKTPGPVQDPGAGTPLAQELTQQQQRAAGIIEHIAGGAADQQLTDT